jgi:hypothetical protein
MKHRLIVTPVVLKGPEAEKRRRILAPLFSDPSLSHNFAATQQADLQSKPGFLAHAIASFRSSGLEVCRGWEGGCKDEDLSDTQRAACDCHQNIGFPI